MKKLKFLSDLFIHRAKLVKLEISVFEASGESLAILGQLEKEVGLAKKGLKEIRVETVVLENPESKGKLDRKEIRVK